MRPQDKANNALLMAEFRRQMGELTVTSRKRYLLTAFTPAGPAKIAAGWDIGADGVFHYMDFANLQGYDFHGAGSDNSWEPNRTGRQADLNLPGRRGQPAPAHHRLPVLRARLAGRDGGGGQRRTAIGDRSSPRSIGQKTTWLKSKGLLGAMVWEMSGDTADGPLMTAIHNGL